MKRIILFISLLAVSYCNGQVKQWETDSRGYNDVQTIRVAADRGGNFYTIGNFYGDRSYTNIIIQNDTFNYLNPATIVAKYNNSGQKVWLQIIKSGGTDNEISVVKICTDSQSNVYVLFSFLPQVSMDTFTFTSADYLGGSVLVKYNSSGSLLWAKKIADGVNMEDMSVTANGNIYIDGYFDVSPPSRSGTESNLSVLKYNTDGNIKWMRSMGDSSQVYAWCIKATDDGYVYIGGTAGIYPALIGNTTIYPGTGGDPVMFVTKLDSSGNSIWAKPLAKVAGSVMPGYAHPSSIAADGHGNFYLHGYGGGLIFGSDTLSNNIMFLAKYDTAGNSIWGRQVFSGYTSAGWGTSVAYPEDAVTGVCNSVWVSGGIDSVAFFSGDTLSLAPGTPQSSYVIQYSGSGTVMSSMPIVNYGFWAYASLAANDKGDIAIAGNYFNGYDTLYGDTVHSGTGYYLAKYSAVPSDPFSALHDTTICTDKPQTVSLQVTLGPTYNALWSTGATTAAITVTDSGSYWVAVNTGGCAYADTVHITGHACDSVIVPVPACAPAIPNAFTPNGDGVDDIFRPIMSVGCDFENYTFSVYSRWGNQVFFSRTPGEGWNGSGADAGTYMYELTYIESTKKGRHIMKGDVTLVR